MSSKITSVADYINFFGIGINLIQFAVIIILAWNDIQYPNPDYNDGKDGEDPNLPCEIR